MVNSIILLSQSVHYGAMLINCPHNSDLSVFSNTVHLPVDTEINAKLP